MRATFYLCERPSRDAARRTVDGRTGDGARTFMRGATRSVPTRTIMSACSGSVPDALAADATRNLEAIAALTGPSPVGSDARPLSFAYPYGVAGLRAKRVLGSRFAGLRGIEPGVNAGWIDLAHLKGQELYDGTSDLSTISALLDDADRRRGWLVLYTHDVSGDPSPIGCRTDYFARVVDLVARRGIAVRTVAAVLASLDA